MSPDSRAPLCLVAGAGGADLANAVAAHLGARVTPSRDDWFACGEHKHVILENVRGHDCYVFQRPIVPGGPHSIYDHTIALLNAVDALRHSDAMRVTVVVPYLAGARQDKRKRHVREGVATGLMARLLIASGVSMVLTVEPHSETVVGAYDPSRCVFEAIAVATPFMKFVEERGLVCDVVASTDVGGLEMARTYAMRLGRPIAALSKERDYSRANTVLQTAVLGDVAGRSVLIVDDIVDTAGSMAGAVRALWDRGARDVVVATVHLLASGPGWERLHALHAEAVQRGFSFRLCATDSVLHPDVPDWVHYFPLTELLAQVVASVNRRGSVRALEDP